MRRKISILLIAFASVFPAFAEEVFFSSIVNASYLTDFALNMFPVSFWGEFGIDHLDIFEDLNTKAVVRVEAGMAQRTVRQNPSDGSILDYTSIIRMESRDSIRLYSLMERRAFRRES